PARQQEVPALGAIRKIGGAFEAGLVEADHAAQFKVLRNGIRWTRVVEIQDGHVRVRIRDPRGAVGDVLRDQVPDAGLLLLVGDNAREVALPRKRYPAEIRFVANLEEYVVEARQLPRHLPRQRILSLRQIRMLERVDLFPPAL